MSYSSQRYDLDAAAARKRSQSFSRDRDQRYHSQSYNNRSHHAYYRAPEVSRTPSYAKSQSCFSMKKGRSRSQRQTRPEEQERSYADYTRRGDRSSGNRRIPSDRESGIKTNETTWSSLDVAPNGEFMVFDMLGDLYKVSMSGGDATPLTQDFAWNIHPSISPDGKQIAFISDKDGLSNVWVMDIDRSEEHTSELQSR